MQVLNSQSPGDGEMEQIVAVICSGGKSSSMVTVSRIGKNEEPNTEAALSRSVSCPLWTAEGM